jgi:hypothetical protein
MKLILSRKGFDSSAGGTPSPILPDGRMLSLPIPDKHSPIRYQDITFRGHNLAKLVPEFTRGRVKAHHGAHLDPDLVAEAYPRAPAWRPIFGQAGGEQTLLTREHVGPGDLFLFFGWFRRTEHREAQLRFVRKAPDLHVLWGWLQVGEVVQVASTAIPLWATYHPHVAASAHRTNNALYIARNNLALEGLACDVPGAGVFGRYCDGLRLTRLGASRSLWNLPAWFAPSEDRPALGYHGGRSRWRPIGDQVELRSVARGQEFVLDLDHYPEALPWLAALLELRHA